MHSTGAARLSRASRACIRSSSHLGFPRPCPRPLSKFQPCRTYTQTPGLQAAVQSEQTRQRPVIQSALPSIEATLARLLPASLSEAELPFSRALCGSILGKVVEQVRAAADAPSVEDAKASWQRIDEEIRSEMQQQQHPASALTNLATLVITASNDPRRHPISFHLYRVAFGSDPASLPQVEFTGVANQAQSQSADAPLSTGWGDWQSAYHWASLILQGRAPPPPGIGHLLPGEQRAAATSQSAAAYRVFVHLANQGHPRGIFGIGRHLLTTLERGSDPTALGAISLQPKQPLSRQETIAEVERLYRLAGEGGVEEAWFQLGALYAEGKWVRKDDARARGFLEEGVERNSPRACQALSQLLTRESQAPQAPSSLASASDSNIDNAGERQERLLRSLQLLEQGAKLGSAECAFSAGMRYLLQPATPTGNDSADHQSASLDLSLDPSSTSSKPQVDPIQQARRDHKQKWGIEADDEAASRWLRMAADGGSAMAMMNLARMYLEGRTVPSSSSPDGSTGTDSSSRKAQLIESSNLYAKILARAMGPEGQRAKALAEVQAKMAQQSGQKADSSQPEPGLGVGSGRLDDLGVRAEEGLRLVREELAVLGQS